MEAYFAAKASLFEPGRTGHAVLNLDDPHGRLLADTVRVPVTGFSLSDLSGLRVGATHSTFLWHDVDIEIALGGRFNVTNALAAATAATVLGIEPHVVASGLNAAAPVPGRFESVEAGQPFCAPRRLCPYPRRARAGPAGGPRCGRRWSGSRGVRMRRRP